uniref:Uncharacterized protein n=1 Tax=Tetraselmis chuii TaxID=63592 RepID=A0A7S1T4W8_9CHLO|mmetsp:Transcript_6013/g.10855  ORF Transcript_6013/g.10855 Transcript_6013/m.10855 type:complete len:311 (+) Transcript_6013:21-953(+)
MSSLRATVTPFHSRTVAELTYEPACAVYVCSVYNNISICVLPRPVRAQRGYLPPLSALGRLIFSKKQMAEIMRFSTPKCALSQPRMAYCSPRGRMKALSLHCGRQTPGRQRRVHQCVATDEQQGNGNTDGQFVDLQAPGVGWRRRALLAAATFLSLPPAPVGMWRRPGFLRSAIATEAPVACDIQVQLPTNDSEKSQILVTLLREGSGLPVLWNEMEPFAMPGAPKHRLHVHVYDNGDPDIPGIEIAHIHPEEFVEGSRQADLGSKGEYRLEFAGPRQGSELVVEVDYKLKGSASAAKAQMTVEYAALNQ